MRERERERERERDSEFTMDFGCVFTKTLLIWVLLQRNGKYVNAKHL
jgi:hypothetical protein